ncbi:MAG TPA: GAF domain-containing protein, partial [Kofleriaceae bacterium]
MADDSGDGRVEPFARMLANLREPLLLVSHAGVVLAANVAAADSLGAPLPALVGTTLSAHASESGDLEARIVEAAHGAVAVPLRARDGRRFSCHASVVDDDLFLVRLSGGPDPATRAGTFFEMLPRMQSFAAGVSATIEEIVRAMLPFGMSSVAAAMGGVYLLDEDGRTLELAGSIDYRADALEAFRLVPMTESSMPLPDCVRERKPVYLLSRDDYQLQYPRFLEQYPYVHDAVVCLPLVVEDRCIGGIAFGADWPWHIGEAERAFLDFFAAQCASTLKRARRSDRGNVPRDHELVADRFERLHAFTGALASAITPADVAEVAVDGGMAATGAQSGGLWMRDDDGRSVALVRSVGPTGPRPEHHARVPLDRPSRMPILDAIQTGTPVWIESCRQLELRYPDAFAAFSRGGEASLACVPLLAQGRCIGALALNFGHAHRFREHERAFFQMITWYAAQALERARLYAAEQRARSAAEARQRRSAFLAESDTLLATLDYESIMRGVATVAVPRIADWCIVEIEEERLQGRPAIAMHVDATKTAFVLELSARYRAQADPDHGIPAVIRTGRSQLYRTITPEQIRAGIHDRELAELCIMSGVTSSMVVPIAARGQTLGAILLNSAIPARTY